MYEPYISLIYSTQYVSAHCPYIPLYTLYNCPPLGVVRPVVGPEEFGESFRILYQLKGLGQSVSGAALQTVKTRLA